MNVQETLTKSLAEATRQVFSTMLSMEVEITETLVERGLPEATDGLVSFIGLAGTWAGTGSLCCSKTLGCIICSRMLMVEATSIDEEVLDAVAEITNMVIGSVKTELEATLGPLGLSIPTVVFGRNFTTKSAGNTDWMVVRCRCEGEILSVKMCLAPSEKISHVVPHSLGQTCVVNL
ncbi:MAG TPA: chemotaxis protein CheX [Verrucomicrobiae bacterium]|nr:chemotaxis protein CheX [Verrucomicrobiae bacterium]